MANETLSNLSHEDRTVPAQRRSSPRRPTARPTLYAARRRGPRGASGPSRPAATLDLVHRLRTAHAGLGRRRRSRSGSSAASSTSPYNCVDRHLETPRRLGRDPIRTASPATGATITYAELHREVCKAANALSARVSQAGDRVAIYLPMVPEAVIAMLACARIGAPHSVVFGGFSAERCASRIIDCRGQGGHHRRRRLPPGRSRRAQAGGRRGRSKASGTKSRNGARRAAHRAGCCLDRRPRRVVARRRRRRADRARAGVRSTPSTRCSSSTPRARPGSRRASCTRPAAT